MIKKKISSEYNIEKEEENSIEFADKDEDAPIFKIFTFQKMLKIDYNNPNKLNKIEEYYLSHNCKTIYKDEETLIISGEENDDQSYGYNIHTFDNSKTELSIIVSVGATRKFVRSRIKLVC